jgi:hypothetical protein
MIQARHAPLRVRTHVETSAAPSSIFYAICRLYVAFMLSLCRERLKMRRALWQRLAR